jgi:hypothetical protein
MITLRGVAETVISNFRFQIQDSRSTGSETSSRIAGSRFKINRQQNFLKNRRLKIQNQPALKRRR